MTIPTDFRKRITQRDTGILQQLTQIMKKGGKTKQTKRPVEQASMSNPNDSLAQVSQESIGSNFDGFLNEPKFKNQRWTKVIQVGFQEACSIHLHQL